MTKMNDQFYCKQCENNPKVILEIYDRVIEQRVWRKDCYELIDSDFGDPSEILCGNCRSNL